MAEKRKPKSKQLYFTRHDDDLWEVIQQIPEGNQNHEIRKALRKHFLGDVVQSPEVFESKVKPQTKMQEDNEDVLRSIGLPAGLLGGTVK